MEFVGRSLAMTADGLAEAAASLGVKVPEVWAIIAVETRGTGFLADRRPQILFERHVFSARTQKRFDASHPGISAPTPGGYGAPGANQYNRLAEALALDRQAALSSASWGLAQIMGSNHAQAGFDDVESMVAAMVDSEDAQLKAMCAFLQSTGLQKSLVVHDWASLARGYNGPNYAIHQYDAQLRGRYQQFSVGVLPDLDIRAAQLYMLFRGDDCHGVDGMMGRGTLDALQNFQESCGMPSTGRVDSATLQALFPLAATVQNVPASAVG